MPDFTGKYNNRKGNGTVGKKMLFVFNPKAGKGKIKTHLLDIIDIFNKNDYEVIIRSTQKVKDAYEQAKNEACGDHQVAEKANGGHAVGANPGGYFLHQSSDGFLLPLA